MKTQFTVSCSKQSLPKIRAFVKSELVNLHVQDPTAYQLVTAIDEVCANSIIHQHNCDGISCIELAITRCDNQIHIELTDVGSPFPIHEYEPQGIGEIIKNRKCGGLGISLITKIMDKIELIRREHDFTYRFTKILD